MENNVIMTVLKIKVSANIVVQLECVAKGDYTTGLNLTDVINIVVDIIVICVLTLDTIQVTSSGSSGA